jgi:hypothetical protein
MNTLLRYLTFVIVIFYCTSLTAQVSFTSDKYAVDDVEKLVLCNQFDVPVPVGTSSLIFDKTYTLAQPISSISLGEKITATASGNTYSIVFTNFPIVKISGDPMVIDDDELIRDLEILDGEFGNYSSTIGIKKRGIYTASLPKKGYRVQLKKWNGTEWKNNSDDAMFGMRKDKRWLLIPSHNEKLKMHNRVCHDLWTKMHTLYYQDQEPNALATVRSVFVDVFMGGRYWGVYHFMEDLDEKQFKLKKTKDDGTIRGEFYKGGAHDVTRFNALPPLPTNPAQDWWERWEVKYPDDLEDSGGNEIYDWTNLHSFVSFVFSSSNSAFTAEIGNMIKISSVIDYFIFINLLYAEDNTGNNTILARYKDGEPYFYGVWDLDWTLGYNYLGTRLNKHDGMIGLDGENRLLTRLVSLNPDNYKQKVAARWFKLRDGVLSVDSLHNHVQHPYDLLTSNNAYEREYARWGQSFTPASELNYMKNWLSARVAWLDNYFNAWVTSCNAPSTEVSPLNYTNSEIVTLKSTGCDGVVKWYASASGGSYVLKGNSVESPPVYGNTEYYASCTIGSCESSTRTLTEIVPNCSNRDLILPNELLPSAEYKTSGLIQSQSITTGTPTTYRSGKSITLLPGFITEGANVFKTEIGVCP